MENDQDINSVGDDQEDDEQSEETDEEPLTLESVSSLAKGLQKGYTQSRQEMAEIRESLQAIASQMNQSSGAQQGENEYVTVGKLKEALREEYEARESSKAQQSAEQDNAIQEAIDESINQLKADGYIKNKSDEEEFMAFAIENQEVDLEKAARYWIREKKAQSKGKEEAAKTKARQEFGSEIGTSSKTTEEEQGKGVNIKDVRERDFFDY